MKKILLTFGRLFLGLFLLALGIVMTIRANLGLAPWDVFHQGFSNLTGMTIGQASILVGVALVIINSFIGEKIGWATLSNMLFVGIFIDVLMINNLVPSFDSILLSLAMMLLGMMSIGFACYFYIGAGLGSGPRDGIMVFLTKKTKKSVRFVRNSIEITVLGLGYLLGGTVGMGTVITALGIGYFIQLAFKLTKFDLSNVEHRFIDEDIAVLKKMIFKPKKEESTNHTTL